MTVWIDAQLSPDLATWFRENLAVAAVAVRDLELRDGTDEAIFRAARDANAIVLTKDSDFVQLLERRGPPRKRSTAGSVETAAGAEEMVSS